jgi:hypothetical protein
MFRINSNFPAFYHSDFSLAVASLVFILGNNFLHVRLLFFIEDYHRFQVEFLKIRGPITIN